MVDFKKLKNKWNKSGEIPEWYSTNSLQFFMNKYSYKGESVLSRDKTIAKYLADNMPLVYPSWWEKDEYTKGKSYVEVFFNMIWDGYAIMSTPVKANAGLPERGMTVSCSGSTMGNNLASQYDTYTETAILTKFAHGTSVNVDEWLSEGTPLGEGEFSAGTLPIVQDIRRVSDTVTQG